MSYTSNEYSYHVCMVGEKHKQITYLLPDKVVIGTFDKSTHGQLVKAARNNLGFAEALFKTKLNLNNFHAIPYSAITYVMHHDGADKFHINYQTNQGIKNIDFTIYYNREEHVYVMNMLKQKCPRLQEINTPSKFLEIYKFHLSIAAFFIAVLTWFLYEALNLGRELPDRIDKFTYTMIYVAQNLGVTGSVIVYLIGVGSLLGMLAYLFLNPGIKTELTADIKSS